MYSWHKNHTRQCVWVSSAGSWLWDFFAVCMWLWSVTWAYTQALSGSLLPPYDGNESMKWNSFFCLVHRQLLFSQSFVNCLNCRLNFSLLRDISFGTKVCIVKAMVFPAVMYRCESWIIKKAGNQRIDAFKLWSWRSLVSPLDCKEIKPVNPKGNQPSIFIGRTDAEAPIVWLPDAKGKLIGKDPELGKIEGKRRSEWQRMRWLDSITNTMDVNVKKVQEMVKDREVWRVAVHGAAKSRTWLRAWTTTASLEQESPLTVGCYLWRPGQVSSCPNTTGFYMVFAFSTQKHLFAWVRYKVTVTREQCVCGRKL